MPVQQINMQHVDALSFQFPDAPFDIVQDMDHVSTFNNVDRGMVGVG